MSTAHARVRVTIDIPLGDAWGDGCTIEQIKKQATDGAINALRRGLVINGLADGGRTKPDMIGLVVGEPAVTTILVVDEKTP